MNQDFLYIKLKYSLSPKKFYNGVKELPLDFLISFGYVHPDTVNADHAYILKSYEMQDVIIDLITYESLKSHDETVLF